jgi:hypothetical protein
VARLTAAPARRDHATVRWCPALVTLVLAIAVAVPAASADSTRRRCDVRTPVNTFIDCFSGHYHGTGFLPMEETIVFRAVPPERLRTNALWREWVADAKRAHDPKPCNNGNAIGYVGTFSFYNSGIFIACSRTTPNLLSGYFRVAKGYRIVNEETQVTLTHGVFSASAAWDNVLELVFSDAVHQHFAQPEVVLGYYTP